MPAPLRLLIAAILPFSFCFAVVVSPGTGEAQDDGNVPGAEARVQDSDDDTAVPDFPGADEFEFDDDIELPETRIEAEQPFQPAFQPAAGAGTIFGSQFDAFNTPGSSFYLDTEAIQRQHYGNINQVLRQVPGVYLRDEAGFGNFPNISLRGVDTTRSAKITVMEDGVLTAPAPYSAPAAYYFPNVDRMAAVEISKGHSQIRYGPHTTGGAINFVSTLIPEDLTMIGRMQYASFNESRMYAMIGNTVETKRGRFGYLLEGYFRESDGFRTIDEAPDFRYPDNRNTGFTRGEPMIKLFWEPNTAIFQRWEAKAGYTDFKADESYLGLSESDIQNAPLRRYTSSRFDNIDTMQARTYLRWTLGDPDCDCLHFVTTGYYNTFQRNWYKLQDLRNIDTDGDGSGDGVNMSLSEALADPIGLQVLQGTRVGDWRVRNNNRGYYSYGYETVANYQFCWGGTSHQVAAGIRFHTDQIHPFQDNDDFTINSDGVVVAVNDRAPGTQRNRIQETAALATYVTDEISVGKWRFSPGIRFEHLNLSTVDRNGDNTIYNATLDMTGGGVGALYDWSDQVQFLGGFHRGFSPPNPRAVILDGLSEEEALATELGMRYQNRQRAFGAQLIYFYTHFNDLIVIDNIGGTGTGQNENFGTVFSSGIEYYSQYDMGIDRGWNFSNPWHLSLTWTNARVLDGGSADPESIFSRAFPGARVPYIPEWQANVGMGYHFDGWGADFAGTFISESFGSANNQNDPFDMGPNTVQDARFGSIDSVTVFDMSLYADIGCNWRVFGGLQNIFDNRYIISRQPHGPRNSMPLYGYVGLEGKL